MVFSELAADEWATDGFKNKASLASALCKALKWKKELFKKNELAISFFADRVIEARVNKLADSNYRPKFKLFSHPELLESVKESEGSPTLFRLQRDSSPSTGLRMTECFGTWTFY